ncbi:hypothetical protein XACJM35_1070001 [Xanthomonas citri pv. citri]|nr:hypothetical protein XAC902_460001 [Xanthomonas citri pv. citri]CEL46668.1 hypothetical protein XACJM35_1070001 [Xanthomonas citri pv. citri]
MSVYGTLGVSLFARDDRHAVAVSRAARMKENSWNQGSTSGDVALLCKVCFRLKLLFQPLYV